MTKKEHTKYHDEYTRRKDFFKERIWTVSYPRSGNTWVRYQLEIVTGFASMTGGNIPFRRDSADLAISDYAGDRTWDEAGIILKGHVLVGVLPQIDDVRGTTHEKVLYLIRHPIDNFIRHQAELGGARALRTSFSLDEFSQFITGKKKGYFYFDNLQAFVNDNKNTKLAVYYEDMVTNPKEFFEMLIEFVDNPIVTANQFMENYEHHHATSMSRKGYGRRLSSGKVAQPYAGLVEPHLMKQCWDLIEEKCSPEVFELVKRYTVDGEEND